MKSPRKAELAGHGYADVLGIQVSAINMDQALHRINSWIASGRSGYICVTGVHGVMEAQRDPQLARILNGAALNTPDGMPMSWVGRLQGFAQMDRVYGPDLMAELCRTSVAYGYRHFLYGGREGVAEMLKRSLERRFPGIEIVGTFTPPFRDLSNEEEEQVIAGIRAARPHIVWCGLSTPRQERFMARYVDRLGVPLLIGVGAAFDYHTGRLRDSPRWVKRAGLQWLHRLMQDPLRLWKRYARNNPEFLWKIMCQFLNRHFASPKRLDKHPQSFAMSGLSKDPSK